MLSKNRKQNLWRQDTSIVTSPNSTKINVIVTSPNSTKINVLDTQDPAQFFLIFSNKQKAILCKVAPPKNGEDTIGGNESSRQKLLNHAGGPSQKTDSQMTG